MTSRHRNRLRLIAILALLASGPGTSAGPAHVQVIGDSLSEEYAFMIDALGLGHGFTSPDSDPTQANTANWVDILAKWRNDTTGSDYFCFGEYENTYGLYGDFRGGGYEYNFGIPGFKTADWLEIYAADNILDGYYYTTRVELFSQLPGISVVVIMLGGNDLKADYNDIFNDTEPAILYTRIINRLMAWADVVDGSPASPRPVVMCTVPDPGVTKAIKLTYNDPVRRASARAKIQQMNDDLKTAAVAAGYAIADVHALTLRLEDEDPFRLNGQEFIGGSHPENPPEYLLCKDGFHPGTVVQCLIANEVVAAVNQAIGTAVAPLSNREILTRTPGLDPDKPFIDWIATQGVTQTGMNENPDGDPFDNLAEFTFGLSAGTPDPGLGRDWSGPGGGRLGILWSLNPAAEGYVEIAPMRSPDLVNWSPLDPADIEDLGSGHWRASIDSVDPAAFLKADVTLAP